MSRNAFKKCTESSDSYKRRSLRVEHKRKYETAAPEATSTVKFWHTHNNGEAIVKERWTLNDDQQHEVNLSLQKSERNLRRVMSPAERMREASQKVAESLAASMGMPTPKQNTNPKLRRIQ